MNQPRQELSWRRSTRCANGNCVEVAKTDDRVLVRNSAEPGVVVSFSSEEWAAFLEGSHEFR